MDLESYTKQMSAYFKPLVTENKGTHRAVDWGSETSQYKRFEILCALGDVRNASLLDVGCGTGALVNYLNKIGYQGQYLGIDILPEMIDAAREAFPNNQFEAISIDTLPESYQPDYIVESGIFTRADQSWLEHTVQSMFTRCTRGVAFNVLSAWGDHLIENDEFCADPMKLVEFARKLTPYLVVRHDYMPHDVTLYLYKKT